LASVIAREHLARAARALNAHAQARLPALILMTDEKRLPQPLTAAQALPKGAVIVLRHADPKTRESLAIQLKAIARARGLVLLIAGDAGLAACIEANGVHLPEARAREARGLKTRHPDWLVTCAAHSLRGLAVAAASGADAALLAPIFPTESHRARASLGATRARLMAAQAALPVFALGGVDARNAAQLRGFAGIAAIGALVPD
jgi:thiamine-phosphate pyrophosphorylase